MRPINVIIAGGGTGGHLFPGIAIADAFQDFDPENGILFVGTGKPVEKTVLSRTGFSLRAIPAGGINIPGWKKRLKAIGYMVKGIWKSFGILKDFKADIIVGMGGYSSAPVVAAAFLLKKSIVLHEQNIIPGMTNRVLSIFSDRVFVSFEQTERLDRFSFVRNKIVFTGNPLRKDLLEKTNRNKSRKTPFTVFVIGGSQGALALNQAVKDALSHLENPEKYFFIHQTGHHDTTELETEYRKNGMGHTVRPFFHGMRELYDKADLIVCRAGATTVSEIAALGKAAIFVPFPYATDNHQEKNARFLSDAGAAEMIIQKELTGKWLAEKIQFYCSNPAALTKMEQIARAKGKKNAADEIVRICYKLLEEKQR